MREVQARSSRERRNGSESGSTGTRSPYLKGSLNADDWRGESQPKCSQNDCEEEAVCLTSEKRRRKCWCRRDGNVMTSHPRRVPKEIRHALWMDLAWGGICSAAGIVGGKLFESTRFCQEISGYLSRRFLFPEAGTLVVLIMVLLMTLTAMSIVFSFRHRGRNRERQPPDVAPGDNIERF